MNWELDPEDRASPNWRRLERELRSRTEYEHPYDVKRREEDAAERAAEKKCT